MNEEVLVRGAYVRPPVRFGTGGWRAVIGEDFEKQTITIVAQALADRILAMGQNDMPVVIGYDRRFLSDAAARWAAGVLAGNGIAVQMMKRSAPTPLIMHTVMKKGLHYGLEVTASHNPPVYNGIKVIVDEGRDAPVSVTEDLEKRCALIENVRELPFQEGLSAGLITILNNPFNDFLDDILGILDTDAIRERGPRILYDSMHGSSTYPISVIFGTTRCTIDQIHGNKDAYFGGIMPAPTKDTLRFLADQVVAGGYDIGFGVDGDGDRLGVVDADGTYISANDILVLLYYYLHEYKGWKGPAVRNIATTHLLDRVAHGLGEECYEVPVGFKHISAEIDKREAVLGGESSGGLTVRGHIHGKDSVYAAALFVEMICRTGKRPGQMIEELREKYGRSFFVECNMAVSDVQRERIMQLFTKEQGCLPAFAQPYEKVSYMDGCKVYFPDDSFVICRLSGTEPLLRIFAEGRCEGDAEAYIEAWKLFLAESK
ncbi:MAG: phosphoglucomutase/phosphomannomutase family protein [Lachnospiraceae bacterium]|nr:phosphoglucomutase/phosphomannomutase family protein [Lachnospiraceae bacterium]